AGGRETFVERRRVMLRHAITFILWCGLSASLVMAQQSVGGAPPQTNASSAVLQPVPALIKFGGVLIDVNGKALMGTQSVSFGLYQDQSGGAPLWQETQNVQVDEQGRYAVLLGSGDPNGLPLDLFRSGDSRWLGIQANVTGESEQPRVLLVSVPYALK